MENKRKNLKKNQIVTFLVTVVIVVVVNVIGNYLFTRFDLTSEKRYTLSPTTKEILNGLDDYVYFKVYLEGDFPAGFKTRRKEDEVGTKIVNEGSIIKEQTLIPMSVGTTFTIKNLFFNVPARRNFLKSTVAEMRHIVEEFRAHFILLEACLEFHLGDGGDTGQSLAPEAHGAD